ncbi:MAG: 7-cyano-7-deazaguanine synthase QueC [Gammaproteobacteria bacterium RIFCSPHIGHO2_12_FULL_37_14]|nr:MAG: 7-cyano-7-deazaguanine synthase QueC [Gammaproteobacteria bacterium RIFCSPHIGHO2_12_FULL_37_14]
MKKAVILLSGGLDSATCLAYAKSQQFDCYALIFDYGQKHSVELESAKAIADYFGARYKIFKLDNQQFAGSALTDKKITIPDFNPTSMNIPPTYVPARNTIFLSIALAWAEIIGSMDIFIGVSSIDYSGYPDCRPEYIQAFQQLANLATKQGVEQSSMTIHTPLIQLSKAETIQLGIRLGTPYKMTISCYRANDLGQSCGKCDSCNYRIKGFHEAGIADPIDYVG